MLLNFRIKSLKCATCCCSPIPDIPNGGLNGLSAQDGCYILNSNNINEVERFAFFSKAVFCLLEKLTEKKLPELSLPNILVANDWHSGALAGLLKYFTLARVEEGSMPMEQADILRKLPIIHLAHHLG